MSSPLLLQALRLRLRPRGLQYLAGLIRLGPLPLRLPLCLLRLSKLLLPGLLRLLLPMSLMTLKECIHSHNHKTDNRRQTIDPLRERVGEETVAHRSSLGRLTLERRQLVFV